MKIIRLKSENILRLVAIDITPEGHLITIGGRNGAGKSSVLNSIAMALGGAVMVPMEPIRANESEGKIQAFLDDLVVTRRFVREKQYTQCDPGAPGAAGSTVGVIVGHEHNDKCEWTWGETRSTLTVTNKDGIRQGTPQSILDKLLGKLTFDPLAFSREEPKRQDEILRALVGLDFSSLDAMRKITFEQRAIIKKTHDIKQAQLLSLEHFEGVPETEISLDEVSQELARAEELRKVADDATKAVTKAERQNYTHAAALNEHGKEIERLKAALKQAETKYADTHAQLVQSEQTLVDLRAAQHVASTAIPDMTGIRQRLTSIEQTNAKVHVNKKFREAQAEINQIAAQVATETKKIEAIDEEKKTILAAAHFPVAGLSIHDEHGVMLNGLPFAQASSSEQLKVSVAIGLALNPTFKVLLIRSGNLLDDDNLKAIAAQAEEADAQVWMEYVTRDGDEDVSVMIEEGRVAVQEVVEQI